MNDRYVSTINDVAIKKSFRMSIHLIGGGKEGGGIIDNGGLYQAAAEHGCTIHSYTISVRPM